MNSNLELSLSYALAKQVPDMQRGFRIETAYGAIEVEEDDALAFAALTERLLKMKLAALKEANHER